MNGTHAFDFRSIDCPICEKPPTRTLGLRGGAHHRYGLGEQTVIMQCEACTLLFANPFPFPRQPSELYGDPEKYFAAHDEDAKIERYRQLVREIKRRSHTADPALLDVGSGRGELLAAAAREGLSHIVGLDTAPAMIDYVKKKHHLSLVPLPIQAFAAETTECFDAVTLAAVLEHVHDPNAMMAAVRQLTRRGAVLYLDVPNEPNLLTRFGNAFNRIVGSPAVLNLSPTFPPFHVFGFNPRALERLLSKHGFVIEALRIHAAPEVASRGAWRDRIAAFAGTQINRVANLTGTAANLFVWARRL